MSKSSQPNRVLPQGVPGCLKKRQLLNDPDLKTDHCREYGEKFLALGWWEDALAFFQKCQDSSGLEKIKEHSLETGDAYLLARLRVPQDPAHLAAISNAGPGTGKITLCPASL